MYDLARMREPTRSFWLDGVPGQDVGAGAPLPSRAEVVVIGGGITGVSAAYWLAGHGIGAVVLEARGLSGGATGRNGGHISPGTAERFSEACKRYGPDRARAIWDFSHRCAEAVQAFVAEHRVDCELRVTGSVSLALTPAELAQVEETAETLRGLGVGVERWDAVTCAERTRSRSFLGGVRRPSAGQLWPARLVVAVAEQALARGARIHARTTVQAIDRGAGSITVRTDRGDIATPRVVHATNAWTRRLVPALDGVIVPVRGQVIVTAPAPRLWPFGLSTNFGMEYWMQRPDGRIVLGGMRWVTDTQEVGIDDDTAVEPRVSAALRDFLPRHFPELATVPVEREWTGIMGFTPDRAPLVGPLPGPPGEYIAAGFHGHGMPMAFFAAKAVAEMIAGKEPETFVPEAFLPERFARR
jgi:glycine/D-amino acid oxidase-like deaminating enzyme